MTKLKNSNKKDLESEKISEGETGDENTKIASIMKQAYYAGPIPPPAQLKEYNEIIPDGADRILRMAEKALDGELETNKKVLEIDEKKVSKGQRNALIISLSCLITATVCVYLGNTVVATSIIGAFAVTVIPHFFYSKLMKKESKEGGGEKKIGLPPK